MRSIFLLSLVLFSLLSHAQNARIEGKVKLEFEPPDRPLQQRYADIQHEELGPPPPPIAVIYLEGNLPAESLQPPEQPEVILQQGLRFYPRVLPVIKGSSVAFPNEDNTFHNVFSYSPAKRFDLGRYRQGEGPPIQIFDQPGEVRLFCEVHPHMRATILVLETPYYTSTDEEGHYAIEDIPPGEYTLVAWIHPRKVLRQTIRLEPGQTFTYNHE